MQYFGIKDTDTPAYAIHDSANNAKYMRRKASPEDLTSFVADFEVCFVIASQDNSSLTLDHKCRHVLYVKILDCNDLRVQMVQSIEYGCVHA